MALQNEDIVHIAKLARLRISAGDVAMYRTQLESILAYIAKLQQLDTSGVREANAGSETENAFREDVVEPCASETREQILKSFPRREGDLLSVQAVFESRTE